MATFQRQLAHPVQVIGKIQPMLPVSDNSELMKAMRIYVP